MDVNTKDLKRFENQLDKFFKETPPEELKKILNKYDKMEFEGPSVEEYLSQMEGVSRFQFLQNDIKKWSDNTFGKYRNGKPIAYHLKKEIDEVIDALNDFHQGIYSNGTDGVELYFGKRKRIKFELADCLMLLIDIAAHEGIDTNNLLDAMQDKLEINKKRKWGKPDQNGVIEHIKE